jgi:hypothetical protein
MGDRRRLVWERYTKRGVTDEREVTTPEAVLAEMPTEALVRELVRRGWGEGVTCLIHPTKPEPPQ